MITIELVGRLRKAVSQLHTVELVPQADQHRLVCPLGGIGVGAIEPVEQRTGRLRSSTAKVEFRLATRDPNQSGKFELIVFLEPGAGI